MNIYGASGHGKVVIDIAKSRGLEIKNVLDDNPKVEKLLDFQVEHHITEEILQIASVLAVGDNRIRKSLAEKFSGKFSEALYHSSAIISSSAKLGKGTVVMGNACINGDTIVGEHCIINTGAVVEHDCNLGNFVHISPNAALAGDVSIGEGTHIGIGAVVIPGITIGKWVTVGAGAVVIKDIPDDVVVVGNPAKIIKKKTHR